MADSAEPQTSGPRYPGVWLILFPTYVLLDATSPLAVQWGREPAYDAQGLAIAMGCLMASYGAVIGQWSILAAWAALGPERWPVAVTMSCAMGSGLFAVYLRGLMRLQAADVGTWDVQYVPLALLAIQIPLFLLRSILGWRWQPPVVPVRGVLRFTIRDLLTLTGCVAVILAVDRGMPLHGKHGGVHLAKACACFALVGLGLVVPVLRSVFPIGRARTALASLFGTLLTTIAFAAAASWSTAPRGSFATCAFNFAGPVLGSWSEPNGGQSVGQLLIAVVGLVAGWTVIAIPSLLVFRLIGYRLSRRYRVALVRVAGTS